VLHHAMAKRVRPIRPETVVGMELPDTNPPESERSYLHHVEIHKTRENRLIGIRTND